MSTSDGPETRLTPIEPRLLNELDQYIDQQLDQRMAELEAQLSEQIREGFERNRQTHPSEISESRRGFGRAELYALILGLAIFLLWLRMPSGPLPPTQLIGPDDRATTELEKPYVEPRPVPPESIETQTPTSSRRDRMPPEYRKYNAWPQAWKSFVDQDPLVLTVWLRKAAKADGLRRGRLGAGQGARLERFAQTLLDGEALAEEDLDLARQSLFEYFVALWVEERGRADRVLIDLDRGEIQPGLISVLLEDLDLERELYTQDPDDSSLQAAVARTWIWQQWGK